MSKHGHLLASPSPTSGSTPTNSFTVSRGIQGPLLSSPLPRRLRLPVLDAKAPASPRPGPRPHPGLSPKWAGSVSLQADSPLPVCTCSPVARLSVPPARPLHRLPAPCSAAAPWAPVGATSSTSAPNRACVNKARFRCAALPSSAAPPALKALAPPAAPPEPPGSSSPPPPHARLAVPSRLTAR